tara:strand:+ start:899 stop:1243 length:345 start_codon:yes stop_codon:yes gene_type:complete
MPDKNLTKSLRLSQNIKANRSKLNLRQDDLAKLLGTNRSKISQWENGTSNPSDVEKQKMEQLFLTGRILEDQVQLDPERNALLFTEVNVIGLIGITLGAMTVITMLYLVASLYG